MITPHRSWVADTAASFQEAVVDILISKTFKACLRTGITRIVIGGGVAANSRLRERLTQEAEAKRFRVTIPPIQLCVDNGAMVAGLGYQRLRKGALAPLSLNADPSLHLV